MQERRLMDLIPLPSTWDRVEDHANLYLEEIEDRPLVSSRDHLREEVKEAYENRLKGEWITFFTPTDKDVSQYDGLQERYDEEFKGMRHYAEFSDYSYDPILDDIRQNNYVEALEAIEAAESLTELGSVASTIFRMKSEYKWRDRYGNEKPGNIFPYGAEESLWTDYRVKRYFLVEKAEAEHADLIEEINEAIAEHSEDKGMLGNTAALIKQQKCLPRETIERLVLKCNAKAKLLA